MGNMDVSLLSGVTDELWYERNAEGEMEGCKDPRSLLECLLRGPKENDAKLTKLCEGQPPHAATWYSKPSATHAPKPPDEVIIGITAETAANVVDLEADPWIDENTADTLILESINLNNLN